MLEYIWSKSSITSCSKPMDLFCPHPPYHLLPVNDSLLDNHSPPSISKTEAFFSLNFFFFFPNYPLFGKWVQYRPGFSSQKRNLCDFHSFLTCSLFIHFSSLFYHSDPIHYQSISRRRISSKWILDLLLLILLLYYDFSPWLPSSRPPATPMGIP